MDTLQPAKRSLMYPIAIAALCALLVVLALTSVYLVFLRQPAQPARAAAPVAGGHSSNGHATQPKAAAKASVPPRIYVVLSEPVRADDSIAGPERVLVDLHYYFKTQNTEKVHSLISAHFRETTRAENGGAVGYFAAPEGLLALERMPGSTDHDAKVRFWFTVPDGQGGSVELPGVAHLRKGSFGWSLDSMRFDPPYDQAP